MYNKEYIITFFAFNLINCPCFKQAFVYNCVNKKLFNKLNRKLPIHLHPHILNLNVVFGCKRPKQISIEA